MVTNSDGDRETVWTRLVLRRYRWCQDPTCNNLATVAVVVQAAPELRFDLGNGVGYCARHALARG